MLLPAAAAAAAVLQLPLLLSVLVLVMMLMCLQCPLLLPVLVVLLLLLSCVPCAPAARRAYPHGQTALGAYQPHILRDSIDETIHWANPAVRHHRKRHCLGEAGRDPLHVTGYRQRTCQQKQQNMYTVLDAHLCTPHE
jgi:hypothetical protein